MDKKSSATENIEMIIQSEELKNEKKLEEIKDHGILAVPAIESYLSKPASRINDTLRDELNN